ncbi:universal stress protein [Phenylobacterium immobile]|uniref:universal stress protein n=1 Tax=Phenylobacterium immobile TaxID=21 RepID=UPI000AED02BD|nr:universal stress protein [Phenylobacterium immobile]
MITSEPLRSIPARAVTDGYAAILTHVEAGLASSQRVEVAANLARSMGARLIGLGAQTIEPIAMVDPMMGPAADWTSLLQEQVEADLVEAQRAFERDAAGADLEWRAVQDYPVQAMAKTARAADLIIASPKGRGGSVRSVDPAELVVQAGRPVLIAPRSAHHFHGRTVIVAWKDTREARRAVADAMPFLRRADDVIVQVVCGKDEDANAVFVTNDVATALRRHGVAARTAITHGNDQDAADLLRSAAELNSADLIVAGAYGHSRAREWVFGGVTRALLHEPTCYVLLSH